MKTFITMVLVLTVFFAVGKNSGNDNYVETSTAASDVSLSGAGSTFAAPIYKVLFDMYAKKAGVQVAYGAIGSGGGIRSLHDRVVDFAGSDAFMTDEKIKDMPANIVHMPTCLGAVVVAYNLPEVKSFKLTSDLLAKIFLGQITKWNDPQLKANNPGVNFPDLAITVVHRSDGSGTTAIFSDYLNKVSKEWADKVGAGSSLEWPVGLGGKGNPGVAGTISSTKGALGYVGSEYAFAQKIQMATLKNSAGNYIEPTIASASASAKGAFPDDTRVMLTNSSAPDAYPICGLTWILIYKEQNYNGRTKAQALAMLKLLDWMLTPEAQSQAPKIDYAPLPAAAIVKTKAILRSVTFDGKPLL